MRPLRARTCSARCSGREIFMGVLCVRHQTLSRWSGHHGGSFDLQALWRSGEPIHIRFPDIHTPLRPVFRRRILEYGPFPRIATGPGCDDTGQGRDERSSVSAFRCFPARKFAPCITRRRAPRPSLTWNRAAQDRAIALGDRTSRGSGSVQTGFRLPADCVSALAQVVASAKTPQRRHVVVLGQRVGQFGTRPGDDVDHATRHVRGVQHRTSPARAPDWPARARRSPGCPWRSRAEPC